MNRDPSSLLPVTTAKAIPPLALLVRREAIPAELRKRPQWVLWRYALRNGTAPTKMRCTESLSRLYIKNLPRT